MAIKLIIGLRNPGSAYEHTRHNAGGWFVEALAQRRNAVFKAEKKLHCELANVEINQHPCKAMLPLTFMNHSGQPTREVCQFYRIKPDEILVVHDELDLPAGRIKLKTAGGHGGHNGLRDITAQLGTGEFHRLRIGIGHPGHKDMVLNYVLGKPSLEDRRLIFDAIERTLATMPVVVEGNIAAAMSIVNR
ncbi:aminoacyl-tRNA hydrolase [Legionella spiritensis]|uniref:Peptidyl-tRNA hydrolase n=1 Tax=Legionella spiritensis TaxID=452 RepID=A0A0W0YY52_LEGSP|nr:aminoacyl-tRNA hydrolase [Legionella spiritensis]KTD61583.1 peptidyl-tRNA hydrolase [Legionella spiritensis]SNV32329.1 peptidyl-tRNA hydrolase, PTH1 family [Legionella spiritensis]VEG92244.1 peptidyl-tRNA hydrolase, PTH1 family [Legionella spiritensis]